METLGDTRRFAVLAAFVWGVTAVCFALTFVNGLDSIASSPQTGAELSVLVSFSVLVLACSSVGAILGVKRPHNPVGWIMAATALAYSVAGLGEAFATSLRSEQVSVPQGAVRLLLWIGGNGWIVGATLMATFLLLVFPTGHPPSKRWSVVGWAAALGVTAVVGDTLFSPGRLAGFPSPKPVQLVRAEEVLGALAGVGGALIVFAVCASVVSLFVRFRRSSGDERQQLKWLTYAAGLGLVVFAGSFAAESLWGATDAVTDVTNSLTSVVLSIFPVAVGVAVLRYRLYDIDRLINRTLVYVALTGMLVGTYALVVLALQYVFGGAVQESNVAVAGTTLALAALVRPFLRRIQAFVDRRFYRSRYDAEQTVKTFSSRLRDEIELEALINELVVVVDQTVQPSRVSVWLADRSLP